MPKKKKSQKIVKTPSLLDKLPRTEVEYQEMLIAHSEKMVGPNDTDLDRFFKGQAERQRKRLEDLKNKHGNQ